jgi:hypothetical protein
MDTIYVFQMTIIYVYQYYTLCTRSSKMNPNWALWFENLPTGNPDEKLKACSQRSNYTKHHFCVAPCRTVSHRVAPCRTVSNIVALCHTVSHHVAPCRTVSHRVAPCRTAASNTARINPNIVGCCCTTYKVLHEICVPS